MPVKMLPCQLDYKRIGDWSGKSMLSINDIKIKIIEDTPKNLD